MRMPLSASSASSRADAPDERSGARPKFRKSFRTAHDLVVVIRMFSRRRARRDLLSLSYDANGMTQSALSRGGRPTASTPKACSRRVPLALAMRVHIFHTAPIGEFGMASGGGAIRESLEHCESCGAVGSAAIRRKRDLNSKPTWPRTWHQDRCAGIQLVV